MHQPNSRLSHSSASPMNSPAQQPTQQQAQAGQMWNTLPPQAFQHMSSPPPSSSAAHPPTGHAPFPPVQSPIYPSQAASALSPGFSPFQFSPEQKASHAAAAAQSGRHVTFSPVHMESAQSRQSASSASPALSSALKKPNSDQSVEIENGDDSDEDDDRYLAKRMAQSAAKISSSPSIVPPFVPQNASAAQVFSRPPPSAAAAYPSHMPTPSSSSSSHTAPSSTTSNNSAADVINYLRQPVQLSSAPLNAQSSPMRSRIDDVSDVSSVESSPLRAGGGGRHPKHPSIGSSARVAQQLFSSASPKSSAAAMNYASHVPTSSSKPDLAPPIPDADLDDLLRPLPASATTGSFRIRISSLRERLQASEGSVMAYAGRVNDLNEEVAQLREINTQQYLQLKNAEQHIAFLTNLRVVSPEERAKLNLSMQPGQEGSIVQLGDYDLSSLRGRALEQSHLQFVALEERSAAQAFELDRLKKNLAASDREKESMVSAWRNECERLRKEMDVLEIKTRSTQHASKALSTSMAEQDSLLQQKFDELLKQNETLTNNWNETKEELRKSDLQLSQTLLALETSERNLSETHDRLEEALREVERLHNQLVDAREEMDAIERDEIEQATVEGKGGQYQGSLAKLRTLYEREMDSLRESYEKQLSELKVALNLYEEKMRFLREHEPAVTAAAEREALKKSDAITAAITAETNKSILSTPPRLRNAASAAASPASAGYQVHDNSEPSPLRTPMSSVRSKRAARRVAGDENDEPNTSGMFAATQYEQELHQLEAKHVSALKQVAVLNEQLQALTSANAQLRSEKEELLINAQKNLEYLRRESQNQHLINPPTVSGEARQNFEGSLPVNNAAAQQQLSAIDAEYVASLQEQIAQLQQANEKLTEWQLLASKEEEYAASNTDSSPFRRSSGGPARPITQRNKGISLFPRPKLMNPSLLNTAQLDQTSLPSNATLGFAPDFQSNLLRFLPHLLAESTEVRGEMGKIDKWMRFYARAERAANARKKKEEEEAAAKAAEEEASKQKKPAPQVSNYLLKRQRKWAEIDGHLEADEAAEERKTEQAEIEAMFARGDDDDESMALTDPSEFEQHLKQLELDQRTKAKEKVQGLVKTAEQFLAQGDGTGVDDLSKHTLAQLTSLVRFLSTFLARIRSYEARTRLEQAELDARDQYLQEHEKVLDMERQTLTQKIEKFEKERQQVQAALVGEEGQLRAMAQSIASGGGSLNHSLLSDEDGDVVDTRALTRQNFASSLPLARQKSPFFLKEAMSAHEGSCAHPGHATLMKQLVELHKELSDARKSDASLQRLQEQLADSQRINDQLQHALDLQKEELQNTMNSQNIVAKHDLSHQVQNLTSQAALLHSENASLSHSNDALQAENQRLKDSNQDLRERFNELDEDFNELEMEERSMRQQLEGRLFESDELFSKRRRLADGTPNPQHPNNQKLNAHKPPDRQTAAFQAHLGSISQSGKLLTTISADNSKLTSELIEKTAEIRSLNEQLDASRLALKEHERYWKEAYSGIVAKTDAQQKEFRQHLEEMKSAQLEERKGFEAKITLLEHARTDLEQTISAKDKELKAQHQQVLQSQIQLDEALKRLKDQREWIARKERSWILRQEILEYLFQKRSHIEKARIDALIGDLKGEIERLKNDAKAVAAQHLKDIEFTKSLAVHPVASALSVYVKSFPGNGVSEKLSTEDHLSIKVLDLLREKLLLKIEAAAGIKRKDEIENMKALGVGFSEVDASKKYIDVKQLVHAPWSTLEQTLLQCWDLLLFQQFSAGSPGGGTGTSSSTASEFTQEKIWLFLKKMVKKNTPKISELDVNMDEDEDDAPTGAAGGAAEWTSAKGTFNPLSMKKKAGGPSATGKKLLQAKKTPEEEEEEEAHLEDLKKKHLQGLHQKIKDYERMLQEHRVEIETLREQTQTEQQQLAELHMDKLKWEEREKEFKAHIELLHSHAEREELGTSPAPKGSPTAAAKSRRRITETEEAFAQFQKQQAHLNSALEAKSDLANEVARLNQTVKEYEVQIMRLEGENERLKQLQLHLEQVVEEQSEQLGSVAGSPAAPVSAEELEHENEVSRTMALATAAAAQAVSPAMASVSQQAADAAPSKAFVLLQSQLSRELDRSKQLSSQLAEVLSREKKARNDIVDLQGSLDERSAEVAALKRELQEAESALEALQSALAAAPTTKVSVATSSPAPTPARAAKESAPITAAGPSHLTKQAMQALSDQLKAETGRSQSLHERVEELEAETIAARQREEAWRIERAETAAAIEALTAAATTSAAVHASNMAAAASNAGAKAPPSLERTVPAASLEAAMSELTREKTRSLQNEQRAVAAEESASHAKRSLDKLRAELAEVRQQLQDVLSRESELLHGEAEWTSEKQIVSQRLEKIQAELRAANQNLLAQEANIERLKAAHEAELHAAHSLAVVAAKSVSEVPQASAEAEIQSQLQFQTLQRLQAQLDQALESKTSLAKELEAASRESEAWENKFIAAKKQVQDLQKKVMQNALKPSTSVTLEEFVSRSATASPVITASPVASPIIASLESDPASGAALAAEIEKSRALTVQLNRVIRERDDLKEEVQRLHQQIRAMAVTASELESSTRQAHDELKAVQATASAQAAFIASKSGNSSSLPSVSISAIQPRAASPTRAPAQDDASSVLPELSSHITHLTEQLDSRTTRVRVLEAELQRLRMAHGLVQNSSSSTSAGASAATLGTESSSAARQWAASSLNAVTEVSNDDSSHSQTDVHAMSATTTGPWHPSASPLLTTHHHHHVFAVPLSAPVTPLLNHGVSQGTLRGPSASMNGHSPPALVHRHNDGSVTASTLPSESAAQQNERALMSSLYEELVRNGGHVDASTFDRIDQSRAMSLSALRTPAPSSSRRTRTASPPPARAAQTPPPGSRKIAEAFDDLYEALRPAASRANGGVATKTKGAAAVARVAQTRAEIDSRKAARMTNPQGSSSARSSSAARPSTAEVARSMRSGAAAHLASPSKVANSANWDEKEEPLTSSVWVPQKRAEAALGARSFRSAMGSPGSAFVRARSASPGPFSAHLVNSLKNNSHAVTSAGEGEFVKFPFFPRGPIIAPSGHVSADPSRFSLKHKEEIALGMKGACEAAQAEAHAARKRELKRQREAREKLELTVDTGASPMASSLGSGGGSILSSSSVPASSSSAAASRPPTGSNPSMAVTGFGSNRSSSSSNRLSPPKPKPFSFTPTSIIASGSAKKGTPSSASKSARK